MKTTSTGETVTNHIAVKDSTRARLARLAASTKRAEGDIADEALAAYLDHEEQMITEIQAGQADTAAGRVVSHAAVKTWVASIGTEDEQPAPKSETP